MQGRSPLSTPEQLFSNRSLRIGRHTSIVASNLPEAALSFAGVLRRPRRFSVRLFVQDADFLFERDFMGFAQKIPLAQALHKNYKQPQEVAVCSEPNYHF